MHYQVKKQISQVVSIVDELFKEQIVGVYLYGSAILGGLYQNSDLDILIITDRKIINNEREIITKHFLNISSPIGNIKKPLEITFVNRDDIVLKSFPPRYEYMYGEWLRDEIQRGKIPQSNCDPDLVILLWQARLHSMPLRGVDAKKIIPFISNSEVRRAILHSLPILVDNMKGDERNVLLTLARMWFTVENQDICPKNIAAEWVVPKLPSNFAPLMKMACQAYLGKCTDEWKYLEKQTAIIANFIKEKIEDSIVHIEK